eukprot:Nitzschia sp. Nitz4//scaffold155_size52807//30637//32354//NITZ4_006801-RA/size52807-augustus-gene-0.54-mRNA-1//-1//CDS//3329537384//6391//frame0
MTTSPSVCDDVNPPTIADSTPTDKDADVQNKKSPDSQPAEEFMAHKLPWYKFNGVDVAAGYNMNGMGRGPLVMSNIFLSSAFIYLAQERAGCLDEEGEVIDDCDGEAYGFKPASFVTNIAVISGVLSAFFMPFIGAMVDYTHYRRAVGAGACFVMVLIQGIQIWLTQKTWLAMAVLQAISGFLYQCEILAAFAYLPDMSYIIGEETMTRFTSTFVMTQFSCQSLFLIIVIAISFAFDMDDVATAQTGQAIDVVWSGVGLYLSWKWFEPVPPRHQLPEGRSLWTAGFSQTFNTAKAIKEKYSHGTWWFFCSLVFAEAGVNAFTTVAVVFLDEQMGLSGTEIGIFFLTTLVCAVPGARIGAWVTEKTNPKRSYQIALAVMTVIAAGGAVILDFIPSWLSYVWGGGIGVTIGWFYPVENVFFSMCLPKGQEAELSGFFVYCSQVLVWLPPLIFSVMVEANVEQTWGVVSVTGFLLIGIGLAECSAPWPEILAESGRNPMGEDLIKVDPIAVVLSGGGDNDAAVPTSN